MTGPTCPQRRQRSQPIAFFFSLPGAARSRIMTLRGFRPIERARETMAKCDDPHHVFSPYVLVSRPMTMGGKPWPLLSCVLPSRSGLCRQERTVRS